MRYLVKKKISMKEEEEEKKSVISRGNRLRINFFPASWIEKYFIMKRYTCTQKLKFAQLLYTARTVLSSSVSISSLHPRTVFLLFPCPDETKLERIVREKRVHEFVNNRTFDDMREHEKLKFIRSNNWKRGIVWQ